ncbi:MAG: hypothetical protein ACFFD8_05975 [Candidatus Thorarchaeota archaeon]
MKCTNHVDHDAIAVCRICGSGICNECRTTVSGIAYCQSCLDSGLYRPPGTKTPDEIPIPQMTRIPTRFLLLQSIVGSTLLGIAFHLLWLSDLLVVSTFGSPLQDLFYPINPVRTIGFGLIGLGITLTAFAFIAIWSHYNSKLGIVTAVSSFIFGWWLFATDLLLYTGLVVSPPAYYIWWALTPGPLYPLYLVHFILGWILTAASFLLWAATLIHNRRAVGESKLAFRTSLLFLISSHLILIQLPFLALSLRIPYVLAYTPYWYTLFIPSAFLLEPSCILLAILLNRYRREFHLQYLYRPHREW